MHLAATLKKLLTIMLLIALSGQTSGCFQAIASHISFIQEAEDMGDNSFKEKVEKEHVSQVPLRKIEFPMETSFVSCSRKPLLSPTRELLTPPPELMPGIHLRTIPDVSHFQ